MSQGTAGAICFPQDRYEFYIDTRTTGLTYRSVASSVFIDTASTEIYTLSLPCALPICTAGYYDDGSGSAGEANCVAVGTGY